MDTGVFADPLLGGFANLSHQLAGRRVLGRLEKGGTIELWKRYVDDIFYVISSCPDDLVIICNGVNESIQFTQEVPDNLTHSIPFLDVLVTRSLDGFETELYIKNCHSGHIIPWSSSTPRKLKMSIIQSELRRARTASSTKVKLEKSIHKIYERFIHKGYPRRILNNVLRNTKQRQRNQQGSINKKACYFRFPFISDSITDKARHMLLTQKFPLNVRMTSITQPPLVAHTYLASRIILR